MTGTGEAVLFWVVAPIMVLAALALLFAKKAVHVALMLALVMIGLAFLYAAQDAPFLAVVQVVVYTGAVMMLFLFVLMLVGVDSSDSLVETIKGQRVAGMLLGLGMAGLLLGVFGQVVFAEPVGLVTANADTNPVGVARLIFSDYVFAFEATGALLITAALGAIMLTQAELSRQRVSQNTQVPPMPAPGVFARHNAVDTPALLPDGTPSELSLSRVLTARGQNRRVPHDVAAIERVIGGGVPHSRTGVVGESVTGHGGSTTATPRGNPSSAGSGALGDDRSADDGRADDGEGHV
jgi:NADH-quinone oxidoreductase subunit J